MVVNSTRSFIFYVSIHTCLFRKIIGSTVWATKMWGRGIICTSLEINQIFPICFECVHLHSCVTEWHLSKGNELVRTNESENFSLTPTKKTNHFPLNYFLVLWYVYMVASHISMCITWVEVKSYAFFIIVCSILLFAGSFLFLLIKHTSTAVLRRQLLSELV